MLEDESVTDTFLIDHGRWRATKSGDAMNREMKAVYHTKISSRKADALQFVEPFTSILSKIWLNIALLILSVWLIYDGAATMRALNEYGTFKFKTFRLVTVDDGFAINTTRIRLNALLWNGCEVPNIIHANANNSASSVTFADGIQVNGFVLALEATDGKRVSAGFQLQGSNDGEQSWTVIGTPDFRQVLQGIRFLGKSLQWSDHQEVTYDYRARWPLIVDVSDGIVLGICALCAAFCGIAARFREGKKICVGFTTLLAIMRFVSLVGYAAGGQPREIWLCFAYSVLWLCFAAVLQAGERWLVQCILWVGVGIELSRVISDCAIFSDCSNLQSDPPVAGACMAVAGLFIIISRARFLVCAVARVEEDSAHYEEEWQGIAADSRWAASICDLEALTRRISDQCGSAEPRHYNRTLSDSSDLALPRSVPGTKDLSNPVSSLDQLYSQALGLVSILKAMSGEWSARSNGTLCDPITDPADFPWSRTFAGEQYACSSLLKSPQRAIEKALVVYRGDVSRVVDICRQRIVFDNVSQVVACLYGIAEGSPDVRIVQIKNSLCHSHDSRLTGGFRGVVVHLCVETNDTRLLGIENHVCEVQLIVKNLAPVRDNAEDKARHARYLLFRMVREHIRPYHYSKALSVLAMCRDIPISAKVGSLGSSDLESGGQMDALFERVHSTPKGWGEHRVKVQVVADSPYLFAEHADDIAAADRRYDSDLARSAIEAGEPPDEPMHSWTSHETVAGPSDKSDSADVNVPVNNVGLISRHYRAVTEALSRVYLTSTLHEGGTLDRRKARVYDAMQCSSASSVWFTSKPLAAAGTKRVFQLVLWAYAVYELYVFIYSVIGLQRDLHWKYDCSQGCAVRFTTLGLRDPERPVLSANVQSFGLLSNNCRLPTSLGTVHAANNTITIELPHAAQIDGYFFETWTGPVGLDPVRWLVEATSDNGTEWSAIGASGWASYHHGLEYLPQTPYPVPAARGASVSINYRPTWRHILVAAVPLFIALGFVSMAACGLRARSDAMKPIWVCTFSVELILLFAAAVGSTVEVGGAAYWVSLYEPLILLVGVLAFERHLVFVLVAYSLASFVATGATNRMLNLSWPTTVSDSVQTATPVILAFSCALIYFRQRALGESRRLVVSDQRRYDDMWAAITADGDVRSQLSELKAEAEILEGRCASQCRQLNRKRKLAIRHSSFVGARYADTGLPGSLDPDSPVDSVDQLYCQAACLEPILLAKVQAWALASGGCFPVYTDGPGADGQPPRKEFVRYDKALEDRIGMAKRIRWAKVKSVDRAMEKVIRSYKQDVSRLVDVCRQSIVFQDVSDMVACLRAVIKDGDVMMVRVKNRLDLGYDSAQSAGYRDLSLNLRIVTGETRCLGVETHVCEVQLLLRPFAELKSDSGHKRYVAFRNLRGE